MSSHTHKKIPFLNKILFKRNLKGIIQNRALPWEMENFLSMTIIISPVIPRTI